MCQVLRGSRAHPRGNTFILQKTKSEHVTNNWWCPHCNYMRVQIIILLLCHYCLTMQVSPAALGILAVCFKSDSIRFASETLSLLIFTQTGIQSCDPSQACDTHKTHLDKCSHTLMWDCLPSNCQLWPLLHMEFSPSATRKHHRSLKMIIYLLFCVNLEKNHTWNLLPCYSILHFDWNGELPGNVYDNSPTSQIIK